MSKDNSISLVFYGRDADRNRLDLYDASASYQGLARTLAILGHYYVKKEIIAQAPRSAMPLYIVPPEEGSFKQTIIAAAVSGIVSAPFAIFSERVLNSWTPQSNPEMQEVIALLKEQNELLRAANNLSKKPTEKEIAQLKEVDQCIITNQKELQTVRSVTSNSFKAIYRPIGRSANAAGIVSGAPVAPSKIVDAQALAMIEADEVDATDKVFMAVVNSFSRGSKTGIVFSRDFDRGFRIEYVAKGRLPREDDFSWSQYSGRPLKLYGRFVRFFDGNIKKFLVFTVERVTEQADVDEYFNNQREILTP